MTVKKDFPYGDHCAIIIQIDGKSKKTDKGEILMKHVKTLNTRKLQNTIKTVDVASARHHASLHVRHPVQ